MKEALFFNTMLTPKIITILYWVLLVIVVCSGLYTLFAVSFWAGLLTLAGVIGVRIWCELLIVIFKIHENLKRIADREA